LQVGNAYGWNFTTTGAAAFYPFSGDGNSNLGKPTNRFANLFTIAIDSGTNAALSLKTNNGPTQVVVLPNATAVNAVNLAGGSPGQPATVDSRGSDANVGLDLRSQGTGVIGFRTDVTLTNVVQFQILHSASTTRWPTATGSNGGNGIIGMSAGGMDFSAPTIRFTGIGTTAVAANATLNAVASNDLLRSTSSRRYKTEIEALSRDEALTLLRKLNPITYASICEQDDPYLRHSGFIAEDVHEINPLFVSFSKDDRGEKLPESVQYERLTVPLVAGWQDHEQRLAALEARFH
jgi:hypothetical protein